MWARSIRVALGELHKTDSSSKHPILPWLVSYAAGQITCGQIGADGKNTTSETERENIPRTYSLSSLSIFLQRFQPRRAWCSLQCTRGMSKTERAEAVKARHRREWPILRHVKWIIARLDENSDQPRSRQSLCHDSIVDLLLHTVFLDGCCWAMRSGAGELVRLQLAHCYKRPTVSLPVFARQCRHAPHENCASGEENVTEKAKLPVTLCREHCSPLPGSAVKDKVKEWLAPSEVEDELGGCTSWRRRG